MLATLITLYFTAYVSAAPTVIIYGSTPAGITAAVAAARSGAATTLLDPSPRLGGMCTGGLGHTDVGDAFAIGGLAREFFIRNARAYNASADAPLYNLEPRVAEAIFFAMLSEAGVARLQVAPLLSVAFDGARVARLQFETGAAFSVPAGGVVVDATYEGDVIVRGSPTNPALVFTFGREAASVYNESWGGRREPFGYPFDSRPISPLSADGGLLPLLTTRLSAPLGSGDARVQGYNFRLCAVARGGGGAPPWIPMPDPVPGSYNASEWELLRRFANLPGVSSVRDFAGCEPIPNGKFDCNNGALISTDFTGASWGYPDGSSSQRAAIVAAHKAYTIAFFYTLRNDPAVPSVVRQSAQDLGLCGDEFLSNGGWPEQLYVREAARMVGDRVLVQNDLWGEQGPTDFGNASIGLGSYAADGHYSTRGPCVAHKTGAGEQKCAMVTSEEELRAAAANGTLWTGGEGYVGSTNAFALYQIPLWALFPPRVGATNLISPTAPSASHVTFASLRVEPTYMVMGHAAGDAAALAAELGCPVQDVPTDVLHARLGREGAVLCHQNYPHC